MSLEFQTCKTATEKNRQVDIQLLSLPETMLTAHQKQNTTKT